MKSASNIADAAPTRGTPGGKDGAFLLGYGNLLTSPFAVAFLNSALPGTLTTADRDFSQMFLVRYMETTFARNRGEAKKSPAKANLDRTGSIPQKRSGDDFSFSDLFDPAFGAQMASLVEAYRQSGDFHPEISLAIADYYGKAGDQTIATAFLRQIADRPG